MCQGYQFNLVFDVQWINGSLVPTVRPVLTPCPEDPRPIIAGVFLSLIFVTAFLLNMMVVVTVATSYTLKRFLYCHILMNLCVTCMIDCIFNLTISIGYVTTAPWRFGYSMSFFNGFTINMLNSEMAFAVLLLSVDRIAAAKKFVRYLNLSECRIGLIILATWTVAFLLASPIVCGFIFSIPYRNRYSCSVADPRDDYFLIVHFILVIIFSTVTMIVLLIITSVTFHRERKKQKKIKGNQTMGYFDQILMTPYFRTEFYPAVFCAFIVMAYILLWLPFSVTTTLGPMISKHWDNKTTGDADSDSYNIFDPKDRAGLQTRALIDESQLNALNTSVNHNVTSEMADKMNNMTLNENLIPEIVDTPVSDTVFIWFRYIFDLMVPILVFIILKDVRGKCESLIMCCRPNSVDVASPKPMRPPYLKQMSTPGTSDTADKSAKSQKKQKGSGKNTIGFKTPILFATSEGLHIRTVEETYLDMIDNKPLIGFGQKPAEPVFTYDLCDVMLGYEDLTDFDGQFHIDDSYDNDRDSINGDLGQSNRVVMGANRAAMGQRPQVFSEDEDDISPDVEVRPPTPPKVHIVGNEPAMNLGDDVDVDVRRHKGKKVVRFATMLNEEIPRPDSPDSSSALESSSASTRSSDSGIMADNERSSATQDDRKPRFTVNPNRNGQRPAGGPEPKRPGAHPPPRRTQPPARRTNPPPKKVVASKVRNIKSRHMQDLNGSLSSLEGKPNNGKRFSKPSAGPTATKDQPRR